MEGNQGFEFTYSAPQQKEVEKIRAKYLPREQKESKLDRLKRLDRDAERPGKCAAITVGVIGTLLLGAGMSFVMELTQFFAAGIVLGVVGLAVIAAAYPLYLTITRRRREKIAPEVLRLSEEIESGL